MERFVINMPDVDIANVEQIARENGITMSWFYRALLTALEIKFKKGLPADLEIHRPDKFQVPFRQTTICMYGDKKKWMSLSRIWMIELGPLVRFALDLYYKSELSLDLESSITVKQVKTSNRGKIKRQRSKRASTRYIYLFQSEADCHTKKNFRPKNPERNIFLMEWGLSNRINPLILS